MKKPFVYLAFFIVLALTCSCEQKEEESSIDRKALVTRHNVKIEKVDTLASLSVGNGRFAFTVDATGLQSFPEFYAKGVPLGTQSEWGWHSLPNKEGFEFSETLKGYDFNETGKEESLYAVQFNEEGRNKGAVNYFRTNPHRLQLGNVGLEITKEDGSTAQPNDLKDINQVLDLWTGKIESSFSVDGVPVKVTTYAHNQKDIIAFRVESQLVLQGRIKVKFRFPYPTVQFSDRGVNYSNHDLHKTTTRNEASNSLTFQRELDNDIYFVNIESSTEISVPQGQDHLYEVQPESTDNFEMAVEFTLLEGHSDLPSFKEVTLNSGSGWQKFWNSGAAVDFDGSTDPRAFELERRVILSQYLTRLQCAGNFPIQETGLTYNSWYGKPHMEMYWWHAAHFALWNRTELLENSMNWYFDAFEDARQIAKRQGYKGVRWQKMTDHNSGEAPSSVGSFLIWQQPHIIYLAELIYRNNPTKENLVKFEELIFATADFMASFPYYDSKNDRYILGKGIIPAQECFDPKETYNPPWELAYWKWGLQKAQEWKERLDQDKVPEWQTVIDKLSPMAKKDGVYLAAESVENSYSPTSKHTIDHPAVLGALGSLPHNDYVDLETMNRTFDIVDKVWTWDHTWGWDFPMEAMTATRLNRPKDAINALFRNETTNTYLPNGHNYQTERLTLYLPGNGGILSAVALMCAGYDGNTIENPGFPKDGTWQVKWEGLKPMP